MVQFDLQTVLNTIATAKAAVTTAINSVQDLKDAGVTLTSASAEDVEKAIGELEQMLPQLREATQNKLRGTSN